MKRLAMCGMVGALLASTAPAQIYLSSFTSRAVKDAKNVYTNVDTVLVRTVVDAGVATTNLTMVLRPDLYRAVTVVSPPPVPVTGAAPASAPQQVMQVQALDSIEISTSFTLPTDFVAESLYLWTGGQRVAAQIQDRALAQGQYDTTVGKRKDPALLEFWGNGSYNLRIFPAASNVSRKVEIVFHHTFGDSASVSAAAIPLFFDTANSYYYQSDSANRSLGYLRADLAARDGRTYSFSMPGLGAGSFTSGSPLSRAGQRIVKLGSGTITCGAPSGAGVTGAWIGRDKIDARSNIGFATVLAESTVTLAPEPATRIIVVDVRRELWDQNAYYQVQQAYANPSAASSPGYVYPVENLWLRAQKYAVMCVQKYVAAGQKFNIVFAGAAPHAVFSAPVNLTADNLLTAYTAIRAARPDSSASTQAALSAALGQAPGGIAILISDLYQPAAYDRYMYDKNGNFQSYQVSPEGLAYDTLLQKIAALVASSDITLFTIADDYRLSNAATASGGFQLASLRWEYYYASTPLVVDGVSRSVPQLPALFLNPYQGGISGIKIACPDLDSVVFTTDGVGYAYPMMGAGTVTPVSDVASPGGVAYPYYRPVSAALRVAGKLVTPVVKSQYAVAITGKLGGLSFTKSMTVVPAAQSVDGAIPNVQWAFRKSEQLANDNWFANEQAIKAIGTTWHIVTRQTSLLALEPGMVMWKDTVAPSQTKTAGGATNAAPTAMGAAAGSIDSLSLDEMIALGAGASEGIRRQAGAGITVAATRLGLQVSIPPYLTGSDVRVTVFDAHGRTALRRTVRAAAGSRMTIGFNDAARRIGNGYYTARISVGDMVKLLRFPIVR